MPHDALPIRVSDGDRDLMIALLREHSALGNLSGEEFVERMQATLEARTTVELERLLEDLPLLKRRKQRRLDEAVRQIATKHHRRAYSRAVTQAVYERRVRQASGQPSATSSQRIARLEAEVELLKRRIDDLERGHTH